MSTLMTLDLIGGSKSDQNGQIANEVRLVSRNGYSEILFNQCAIPAAATFLRFEIRTKCMAPDPTLGNVHVGIQPAQGASFFRIVQGNFEGTLALSLAGVSGQTVSWLGIGFPAGAFGPREFIAVVANLRFINDAAVPEKELRDVTIPAVS